MNMEIINWVTGLDWQMVINVALQAVGLAALISSQTPNKSDDKVISAILTGLNFLGANFAKSENK